MKRILFVIFSCLIGAQGIAAAPDAAPYAAIYDHVLQANADRAVNRCTELQQALGAEAPKTRHQAFVDVATAWARVQASYVLGGYDMDAMDYPLMVDYFHMSKEDIHASLDRLIHSDTPAARALYKNSYKTLVALDDVMFSGPWSPRRAELAGAITRNVCKRLEQIRAGYAAQRDAFLANRDKALALLINAQIDSLYKTRDWRIAQVGGLTKKTLGQAMPQNQQYPYSKASWAVIGAIIATHAQLLDADQAPNIATIAHQKQADEGLAPVQEALAATEQAYRDTRADHDFSTQDVIPVFQGLLDTQKAFYRHLVGQIGVTANIIDADGD